MSDNMEIKMPFYKFREMENRIDSQQKFIEEWIKSEKVVLIDAGYEGNRDRQGVPKIIAHGEAIGNFLESKYDLIARSCVDVMDLNRKNYIEIAELRKENEQLKKKKRWF